MNILPSLVIGSVLALAASPAVFAQTSSSFEITQEARNLTKQNFVWTNAVQTEPGDRIEFRIIVTWRGSQSTQNVFVREALGQGLIYQGNLKLDGSSISGNITQENITIGQLASGQSKTVTFEAQLAGVETFPQAVTEIVNTATVFSADGAASVFSTVQVHRAGVPTDVSTGPLSIEVIGLILLLFGAAGLGGFLFIRSSIQREVFESTYDTRSERKLTTLVDRIKAQERRM